MPRWNYKNHGDRFLSKVRLLGDNDCWEWQAGKNNKGYGRFHYLISGKRKYGQAHRFSWLLFVGKIPNGMLVCHSCDNPGCVNPKHLFIGSNQDNMDDRNRKNRQAKLKGSTNGFSKLKEEEVKEIKSLVFSGEHVYSEIAKRFNVCQSTISAIANGQNWSWLDADGSS